MYIQSTIRERYDQSPPEWKIVRRRIAKMFRDVGMLPSKQELAQMVEEGDEPDEECIVGHTGKGQYGKFWACFGPKPFNGMLCRVSFVAETDKFFPRWREIYIRESHVERDFEYLRQRLEHLTGHAPLPARDCPSKFNPFGD